MFCSLGTLLVLFRRRAGPKAAHDSFPLALRLNWCPQHKAWYPSLVRN